MYNTDYYFILPTKLIAQRVLKSRDWCLGLFKQFIIMLNLAIPSNMQGANKMYVSKYIEQTGEGIVA